MAHTQAGKADLRFFWNGIKAGTGKLQKCYYSDGALCHHPAGTLTVYAKDGHFSAEVRRTFTVENDSDIMTDYFEDDRFRVLPDHPLYAAVKAALEAKKAHYARRVARVAA